MQSLIGQRRSIVFNIDVSRDALYYIDAYHRMIGLLYRITENKAVPRIRSVKKFRVLTDILI